jgi:hypothetical protein
MRFIPTTAAQAEQFKKQAKKLQRNGSGKHADLLNRVARSAGYDHWHHVTQCLQQSEQTDEASALKGECAAIIQAEREGIVRLVMTGRDVTVTRPLVLFSTGFGDAWLLDADENLAACLMWHGVEQSPEIRDLPNRLEVNWDGAFELAGDFFKIETEHRDIGVRAIGGYPLGELRKIIDKVQSVERRMKDVIFQDDAIDLTSEIVEQLVRSG